MKNGHLLPLILLALWACSSDSSAPQPLPEQSALLLGVYHFDNPGRDTHNMEIDDYFAEDRQAELAEVANLLAEYQPTKILVELPPRYQPWLDSLYALYAADAITLEEIERGRNEVFQLGFRLAKQLGGVPVVTIDHSGAWLGEYADFIADTLGLQFYLEAQEAGAANIKIQEEQFRSHTVRENLTYLNQWEQIQENQRYYNQVAVRVQDTTGIYYHYQEINQEIDGLPYLLRSFDFNNIGVELVAEWYKRNLFIYRNILQQTHPEDRVLIIIGAGHVRYLHQMLSDNSEIELISPENYLSVNQ